MSPDFKGATEKEAYVRTVDINLTGAWGRQGWVGLGSRTGLPGPRDQPILSSDAHDIPGNACPALVPVAFT